MPRQNMQRETKNKTIGIQVTAKAKERLEELANDRNQSVSEYMGPAIPLVMVFRELGLSLDEALDRLRGNDVSFEDVIEFLAGDQEDQSSAVYRRPRLKRQRVEDTSHNN